MAATECPPAHFAATLPKKAFQAPLIKQTTFVCSLSRARNRGNVSAKALLTHGLLDRAVAEQVLDRARIVPGVGERIAASVTEHMGVGRRQSCPLADALEKPADGIRREWAAAGCLRAESLLQLVQLHQFRSPRPLQ